MVSKTSKVPTILLKCNITDVKEINESEKKGPFKEMGV